MLDPIRLELPTGFEFGTVNAYLFPEPEPTLVDTGLNSEASWTGLQAGLAQHGLTVADLTRLVITHPHVDHFGQAGQIMAHNPEARLWIDRRGAPWLFAFAALMKKRINYYRDILLPELGLPCHINQQVLDYLVQLTRTADPVPARRIRTFQVGESLAMGGLSWQILSMPGHTSSQTCFYQARTDQFLSADMLLAKIPAPIVDYPTDDQKDRPAALALFLESLTRVEALDIEVVYPGHGEPFTDHRQVIERQRDRLEQRRQECLNLIAAGRHTVTALMESMYTLEPSQFQLTALWMLIGYLKLLQAKGLVEERYRKGVRTYYPL